MRRSFFLIFIFFFRFIFCFAQSAGHYFVLKDVSLIDVNSKKILNHYTILIHSNKIDAVGPNTQIKIPDSATILNYASDFVTPGLIDSHVHLATDPSNDDNRSAAEKRLKSMLLSGITSVRDMAGDARALASLSRDAGLDEIAAPDIYYSALMAGPSFFNDPRTHTSTTGGIAGEMPFMRGVTDSTDLRSAIAEAKGTGATGIKLYAALSGKLAEKISTEAHRQHLKVWAHANLDDASTLQVVNAGVDVISHAAMFSGWNSKTVPEACLHEGLSENFWDSLFKSFPIADLIHAMQQHKTILDATVLTYKEAGTDTSMPAHRRLMWVALYELGKRFTKLAKEQKIIVSAGTDLDETKLVQQEMRTLVHDCGFTPMEVVISATLNGAKAIGIDQSVGTIEAGKIADLVVFSADPTANIENIDKIDLVIKNGKIIKR